MLLGTTAPPSQPKRDPFAEKPNPWTWGCLTVVVASAIIFVVWGMLSGGCHNPIVTFMDLLEERAGVELLILDSEVTQVRENRWNVVVTYTNRSSGKDGLPFTATGYSEETDEGCWVQITSTGY